MPPIDMTTRQRQTLERLARASLPSTQVEPAVAKKLLHHGLAVDHLLCLHITTKGQLELLRQRFRGMPTQPVVQTPDHDFISRFERRIENGLRDDDPDNASEPGDDAANASANGQDPLAPSKTG